MDKIKGYHELSEPEVVMINKAKGYGAELGDFIASLETLNVDKRWLAISKTELQKGIMFLVRSIAKPESF